MRTHKLSELVKIINLKIRNQSSIYFFMYWMNPINTEYTYPSEVNWIIHSKFEYIQWMTQRSEKSFPMSIKLMGILMVLLMKFWILYHVNWHTENGKFYIFLTRSLSLCRFRCHIVEIQQSRLVHQKYTQIMLESFCSCSLIVA